MKKCLLFAAAIAVQCALPGRCQEGWRTTSFIAPGRTQVLQWDDGAIGGMAGFQYGLHRGRLITGAGINVSFLRSATGAQPFSGRPNATQPFIELPIGVGIATRPINGFHFELKANVGYLTNLTFTRDFFTISPYAAFLWSRKGRGSAGVVLKAMTSVNPIDYYQPAFYGVGVMFQHY